MPFPVVPDKECFTLDNDGCPFIAKQGVNPLQVLIYKKDGKSFDGTEVLPLGLLDGAKNLAIMYNLEQNEFFGEQIEMSNELSEDDKYFVITFSIVPEKRENKEEQKNIQTNTNRQSRSLSKRLKDWWNNRKSNN